MRMRSFCIVAVVNMITDDDDDDDDDDPSHCGTGGLHTGAVWLFKTALANWQTGPLSIGVTRNSGASVHNLSEETLTP